MVDEENVIKRIQFTTAQFKSLEKVRGHVKTQSKIPDERVQCFCLVSWEVCEHVMKKIEVFYRINISS